MKRTDQLLMTFGWENLHQDRSERKLPLTSRIPRKQVRLLETCRLGHHIKEAMLILLFGKASNAACTLRQVSQAHFTEGFRASRHLETLICVGDDQDNNRLTCDRHIYGQCRWCSSDSLNHSISDFKMEQMVYVVTFGTYTSTMYMYIVQKRCKQLQLPQLASSIMMVAQTHVFLIPSRNRCICALGLRMCEAAWLRQKVTKSNSNLKVNWRAQIQLRSHRHNKRHISYFSNIQRSYWIAISRFRMIWSVTHHKSVI